MEIRGTLGVTRSVILITLAFLFLGCSGASKEYKSREHDVYHEKRIQCEETKSTNETANVTQCVRSGPEGAGK